MSLERGCTVYCNLCSFVRVWKSGGQSSAAFKAHTPAVWTVAGLFRHDGTRRILSGKKSLGNCNHYSTTLAILTFQL